MKNKLLHYLVTVKVTGETYNGYTREEMLDLLVVVKSKRNLETRFLKLANKEFGYRGVVSIYTYKLKTVHIL